MSNTFDKPIWDLESLRRILSDDRPIKSISAIKSCIEADEGIMLLEAINDNYKAKVFALICCFTFIPSAKCIEYLIADGTPLDKTFDNNPFGCTPQEYLDKHFSFTTNKLHTKARNIIFTSIEKGKLRKKNNEHIVIDINIPIPEIKQSTLKRMGKILLAPLSKH
jgi:hypothetical protein